MSAKVNLTKRISLDGKDRYAPVVQGANGRIKPDYVSVDGREVRFPGGKFYIDWTESGKRKRKSAGASASQAVAQQLRKETELKALSQGIALAPDGSERTGTDLQQAAAEFLEETRLTKLPKTISAYTTTMNYFLESCHKRFVEDIDRRDMIQFTAFLRDKKDQAPRSVYNKFENVMSFLKLHKMNTVVTKRDWPRFTEEEVEVYTREELDALYTQSDEYETLLWDFFLMTGERDQEVIYTTWPDINLKESFVQVRHKPAYNWTPKAYKEREIPIPTKLRDSLEKKAKKSGLVFPTSTWSPNPKFLKRLKSTARRTEFPESNYYLHKFRATFATWHLQGGVDIRTVQEWMGHADLESTMRYLKPARRETVRDKVNATFA